MAVGAEDVLDAIRLTHRETGDPASAPPLGSIGLVSDPLNVPAIGNRDQHVYFGDEILFAHLSSDILDSGAPLIPVPLLELLKIGLDQRKDVTGVGEQGFEAGDLRQDLVVLGLYLLTLERRQASQPHVEDGVGLNQREFKLSPEVGAGAVGRAGLANDRDHLIDIVESNFETLEDVSAVPRPLELELCAASQHFLAMADELLKRPLEREDARLRASLHQRQHVDAEGLLQRGVLEQVVEYLARLGIALELDHHPHAGAVRLVSQVRDAIQLAVADHVGDAFEQGGLVHLIGQFGHDDLAAVAAIHVFYVRFGPDHHAPATGGVGGLDTFSTENRSASGEIRTRHNRQELFQRCLRIVDDVFHRIADFVEVVWRDVGRHADGDAGAAVDQQVRDTGGKHRRLIHGGVVVGILVDRALVDVRHHLFGDLSHLGFGVPHGGGAVAVYRAEVALTVNQGISKRERLRHTYQRVVGGGVTVGVEVLDDLADDTRALPVSRVRTHAHLMHRIQHAAVDWLEPIARVWQRTLHDDAHRIVEIGLTHLAFDACGSDVSNIHVQLLLMQFDVGDLLYRNTSFYQKYRA